MINHTLSCASCIWDIFVLFVFTLCIGPDSSLRACVDVPPEPSPAPPPPVQFSCSVVSDSLWSHGLQHTRLPCPLTVPEILGPLRIVLNLLCVCSRNETTKPGWWQHIHLQHSLLNILSPLLGPTVQKKWVPFKILWDFPGSPVAKTLCSQCRGPRFNPWSGN